jgi:hypothetical protein
MKIRGLQNHRKTPCKGHQKLKIKKPGYPREFFCNSEEQKGWYVQVNHSVPPPILIFKDQMLDNSAHHQDQMLDDSLFQCCEREQHPFSTSVPFTDR